VFACKSAEVIFVLITAGGGRFFLVIVVGILTADSQHTGVLSSAGADKYTYQTNSFSHGITISSPWPLYRNTRQFHPVATVTTYFKSWRWVSQGMWTRTVWQIRYHSFGATCYFTRQEWGYLSTELHDVAFHKTQISFKSNTVIIHRTFLWVVIIPVSNSESSGYKIRDGLE
jgi:hypothetical protein